MWIRYNKRTNLKITERGLESDQIKVVFSKDHGKWIERIVVRVN